MPFAFVEATGGLVYRRVFISQCERAHPLAKTLPVKTNRSLILAPQGVGSLKEDS